MHWVQWEHKRRKISPSRKASEKHSVFKHMVFDPSLKGKDMDKERLNGKPGRGNKVIPRRIKQHCLYQARRIVKYPGI